MRASATHGRMPYVYVSVAFGHGPHACAGTRLARMEMEALLSALLDQVERIEVGQPIISNKNTLHRFDQWPMELIASG